MNDIKITKTGRNGTLRIEEYEYGFSVWLNDRWLLDASIFLEDESFSIYRKAFKKEGNFRSRNIKFTLREGAKAER